MGIENDKLRHNGGKEMKQERGRMEKEASRCKVRAMRRDSRGEKLDSRVGAQEKRPERALGKSKGRKGRKLEQNQDPS